MGKKKQKKKIKAATYHPQLSFIVFMFDNGVNFKTHTHAYPVTYSLLGSVCIRLGRLVAKRGIFEHNIQITDAIFSFSC